MDISNNLFQKNKYHVLPAALDPKFCEIIVNYAKFQSFYDFTPEINLAQVANTHSRYADFLMEALLLYLQPLVEEVAGVSLLPTYSYYRVYKQGDKLEPHIDRNACEISASLAFGWPNSNPWAFKLSNDKEYANGTSECHTPSSAENTILVNLNPGDALIYAGPKVKHWRDPLESSAYVQGFFHYVSADGPNAAYKFDNRDAIGVPKLTPHFEYIQQSDWMKALIKFYKEKDIETI